MKEVTPECDHKSVGIIVFRDGKLLLIERKKVPFGFAPPAGHVDEHGGFQEAAKAELKEEVGLTASSLRLQFKGRQENPCRRGSKWHYWEVYKAEATGELVPSPDETKQAIWCTEEELYALAEKTKRYIAGEINDEEWEKSPGLEPVWWDILKETDILWYPPDME